MKRFLFLIVLGLFEVTLHAQVEYRGVVTDAESLVPLANVIVLLKNNHARIVKYTQTDKEGGFFIRLSEDVAQQCDSLEFSLMSYRKQSIPIKGKNGGHFPIRLIPTSIQIKEVVVKARRIGEQGDTLVYNVASYAGEQDRTIGEVLAKMPGIHVDKDGRIKYNGIEINKFYIEGKDLLEGRYNIATKSISHKDISRVEVMENHQPIRVLEGFSYSNQAAINLKLKENVKAKWTGGFKAKGGYADEGNGVWNAELFGMLISTEMQSITSMKSNNNGENLENDIRYFYRNTETNSVTEDLEEYISLDNRSSGNLNEERTLFNRAYMFSTSQLWTTSQQWNLKTQINYLNDRKTSQNGIRTSYLLPDGTQVITEDEQSKRKQNILFLSTIQEVNKKNFYLKHTLKSDLEWNDIDFATEGTYPNRQNAWTPTYKLNSALQWIKHFGKHLVTFSATNIYQTAPQHLEVQRENGEHLYQETDIHSFYTHETANFYLPVGKFIFSVNGGINGQIRLLDSKLTGISDIHEKTTNDLHTNYIRIYAAPQIQYSTGQWHISLKAPVHFCHYDLSQPWNRKDDVSFAPGISFNWKPKTSLSFYLSGSVSPKKYSMNNLYDGIILSNYRTLQKGYDTCEASTGKSLSGGMQYKNTLNEIFANVHFLYSWNNTPFVSDRSFIEDFIVYSYSHRPFSSKSQIVMGDISKGINFLKGIVTLSGNYLHLDSFMQAEDTPVAYSTSTANLTFEINGQPCSWFSWYYVVNYNFSTLKSDIHSKETLDNWQHDFIVNILPVKRLVFKLSGEYYRNEIVQSSYKDMVIADFQFSYTWKDWKITAQIDNLFNKKEYGYSIYNDLTSVSSLQRIRGREFLMGISWRL